MQTTNDIEAEREELLRIIQGILPADLFRIVSADYLPTQPPDHFQISTTPTGTTINSRAINADPQ